MNRCSVDASTSPTRAPHGQTAGDRQRAHRFGKVPLRRLCALFVAGTAAVLLSGCVIVSITGPTQVAIGETVTYQLELGNGGISGASGVNLLIAVEIPDTWALISAAYEGTILGQPAAGLGVPVPDPGRCGRALPPGYQRLWLSAGTFNVGTQDTGRATIRLQVNGLPSGSFPITFRFVGEPVGACGNLMGLTINRGFTLWPPLQTLLDGDGGAFGLERAADAAISPDGKQVYVAGSCSAFNANCRGSLAVLGRDEVSGAVTFLQGFLDGEAGVDGLDHAERVIVTPDGKQVYASGPVEPVVAAFQRDPATGLLDFSGVVASAPGSRGGLASSPDGRHLYVAGASRFDAFERDADSGALSLIDSEVSGGGIQLTFLRAVAISPDGQHLYLADEGDSLEVFARDPVSGMTSFVETHLDDHFGVDGLDGAFAVEVTPDGQQVFVAGMVDDALAVFDRNALSGGLTFVRAITDTDGGFGLDGARGLAVSPDGRQILVGGLWALTVFHRQAGANTLSHAETWFSGDVDGLRQFGNPAVDPSGRHLYLPTAAADGLLSFELNDLVFVDGFESGKTTAWSTRFP